MSNFYWQLYMVPLAFSFAATALVGAALGGGNKPKALLYLRVTTMITLVIVVVLATVMILFRWYISEMYSDSEDVIDIAARNFIIAGICFFLDGINCEMKGIMKAMGFQ